MINFVFQNSVLVIVDKPAGILSVPPRFADERRILGRELETQLGTAIFPVHRLDYEVSGLIIYALTPPAHKILNRAFENAEIQKTYQAFTDIERLETEWTKGSLKLEAGKQVWHSQIERGKRRSFQSPRGLKAVTEAEWKGQQGQGANAHLQWRLRPLTGRPHQLRFELANRGYPIWGDRLYGSQKMGGVANQIALRAVNLEFPETLQQELALPAHISVSALDITTFL